MVEAVMLWNEPNNRAYWNSSLDPRWDTFAHLIAEAAWAVRARSTQLTVLLGGISPIEPQFLQVLKDKGVLSIVDAVAVHGYPLDWDAWRLEQWPEMLDNTARVAGVPVWVTEAGASSFGAQEAQELGLRRTAEMLAGRSPRLYWYCLYDPVPGSSPAAYRPAMPASRLGRHAHMGLVRQDNSPKAACRTFAGLTPHLGICQWFDLFDPRLEQAVEWMKTLGVRSLRTGLSWADSLLPGASRWFDRQMRLLEPFDTCLTLCYTPPSQGVEPHPASPPLDCTLFAEFCDSVVRRYAC
ncbi:MAG: beta-xylosidase [Chitinivibrionales bacterium]|nr:beta-xylosidase [Chitinivibrionales bacterium]